MPPVRSRWLLLQASSSSLRCRPGRDRPETSTWRRSHRRAVTSLVAALALVAGLLPAGMAGADMLDDDWIEVASPHFTLLSRVSEERTRDLAESLELFRQVVLLVVGAKDRAAPVPTEVLVVDRDWEWREIGAPTLAGGFFVPGLRASRIALQTSRSETDRAIVRHEYAHYVLRNTSAARYPRWYDEGFAELLSTAEKTEDGAVRLGTAPTWRGDAFQYAQWLPTSRVIEAADFGDWPGDQQIMFYSQAWLLVHYLMLGGEYRDSFTPRFDAYRRDLEAGEDSVEAFEDAFDVDVGALDRELIDYVERRHFPALDIPLDRFETRFHIELRRPSPVDVALAVGGFQLAFGQAEPARVVFERAIALDPSSGRAHAALGDALYMQKLPVIAHDRYERAVELSPDDPTVHLDVAWSLIHAAQHTPEETERGAGVERARRHLARAWQLDQTAPETYALLGWSHLVVGDDVDRAVEMLEGAERILPSNRFVRLHLAEAYLAAGRDEEAVRTARSVLAWEHEDSQWASRARDVIAMEKALAASGGGTAGARRGTSSGAGGG